MKLWLLSRNSEAEWDEYRAFVVSARDGEEARKIIAKALECNYSEIEVFTSTEKSICKQIGISIVPEGVVCRDFYEG